MKSIFAAAACLLSFSVFAQFAPQVGLPGTTAMHKDSSVFVNWAVSGTLKRGWQNSADTALGLAQVGDSTYIPGKAGNGIVSLGDGGIAIVTFAKPIKNGEGFDFAVFENGFIDQTLKPGTAFLELAFVEVSSDGEHFYRFPATSNTDTTTQTESFEGLDASKINNLAGKYLANYGTPFDLNELSGIDSLDLDKITHVRIIDVVGSIDNHYGTRDSRRQLINDPWPTPFASSGFDLDAVGVIHENTSVGLAEVNLAHEINVYPNPSTSNQSITVRATTASSTTLQIIDNTGKLIASYLISDTFVVRDLSAGMYAFHFSSQGKTYTQKVVIQ